MTLQPVVFDIAAASLVTGLFLLLSIFRASAGALGREAAGARRDWDEDFSLLRETGHPAPPERLRMALQGTRHICLLGGALFLASRLQARGASWPFLSAFAAVVLVGSLLIDQVVARAIALIDPRKSYDILLPVARILSAPLVPLVEPARLMLERMRKAMGKPSESPQEPEGTTTQSQTEVEENLIRAVQGEMIENVVEFSGTIVREIMTPRTDMETIEEEASLAHLVALIVRTNYSRIPVTHGGADHVVGMVHARDVLRLMPAPSEGLGFREVVRPILAVPESKRALELLREMQARGQQIAIVVDEYGGTAGLVTVEDLLEEVVGEIEDEHDVRSSGLLSLQDGTYIVRGAFPVFDLAEQLGVELPDVDADTVGGLIIATLGRLPESGESVEISGVRLEVTEADRRRIRRVRIHPPVVREEKADRSNAAGD